MAMWPERYCVNGGALFTALAALSMVTDIFILALPLRYLLGNLKPDRVARCVNWLVFSTSDIFEGKIQVILLMSLGGL
jgi:hypothetical protein